MKQYIGTKLIEAEPAYRVDGKVVALAENKVPCGYKVERGYKVRYADGYESFSPNEVFERAYLPLEVNGKTTVVRAVLKNGFEIVESSSCVSAENYDEKLGEEICMERIRNKIWELLGFLLQTAVGGVNGEAAADESAVPKLPTVRLFISQPMRGKSDEEIESEREDLIAIAKAVYAGRGEVEVIDSFFKGGLDVPAGAKAPLYYLSKSLELLATADVAIFAKDWREARGCRIEHECADGYGVARIELPEEG